MNVRFLRGLSTAYQAIASKDSKTFYFTTDDNKLYLGDVCLSNQPVEERIKVIEDHGYVNGGEVDGKISAAIANYYTKGEINDLIAGLSVGSIDGRVTALEGKVTAIEAWDSKDITAADIEAWNAEKGSKAIIDANKATWDKAGTALQVADKEELEGKITAHENAVNTKFNDYRTSAAQDEIDDAQTKALNDYKAEMVETLKGYQTTIPAETYDAYGSAAAAETAAKGYADKKLEDFEKAYITEDGGAIDKLNEIAGWIADDKSGAVKIISDVATNAANIKNIQDSAVMNSGITAAKVADIAKGVEAQGWGNHANAGYAKTADISDDIAKGVTAHGWGDHSAAGYAIDADLGDLAKKDEADLNLGQYAKSADLKALAYKAIAEKSDLAADVQASLGKADTALQEHQNISHLATKQEVTDGLALKVDNTTYNAYIEAHKDDYNNAKVDELVAAAAKAGTDAAAAADAKAVAAQGEVDALEGVVAANAQTCQNNFNTISEQLTWGSF